jgi:hypothetical protein
MGDVFEGVNMLFGSTNPRQSMCHAFSTRIKTLDSSIAVTKPTDEVEKIGE